MRLVAASSSRPAESEEDAPACRGCGLALDAARDAMPGHLLACAECGLAQLPPRPDHQQPARFGAAQARRLRAEGQAPDVIHAADLLARAEDPHDVARGARILLAPGGAVEMELPYLPAILEGGRIDLIGGAHRLWFSLRSAEILLAEHGLVVFDAEAGPDGVLRLRLRHQEDASRAIGHSVAELRAREGAAAPDAAAFRSRMAEMKCALLDLLIGARRNGQLVVGHGAGDGVDRLLRYCGVGPELLAFTTTDGRAGGLLPASRIPLRAPEAIRAAKPDFLLMLPHDLTGGTAGRMRFIRDWGGRFVVPIPSVRVF